MDKLEIAANLLKEAKNKEEFDKILKYNFGSNIDEAKKIMKEYGVNFNSFEKIKPAPIKKAEPKKVEPKKEEFKEEEFKEEEENKVIVENVTKMVIDENRPLFEEENKGL